MLHNSTRSTDMSEPFASFAEESGLHLFAEPLGAAPRDVLAPVDAIEQYWLVSLSTLGSSAGPLRLVFLTPLAGGDSPALRDVLWWVAGDAWVLEQAGGSLEAWAATFGYAPTAEGTERLFEQAQRQTVALTELLGDTGMRRLLDIYDAEVAPSRSP